MNMLMLAMASQAGNNGPTGLVGDSCALFLFVSGAVSMTIAAYLLYKEPRVQPVRYTRKH
jgi:hypothetical protein